MSTTASNGLSVLRHRDFTRILGARFCTVTAVQMQAVAIGWQVYQVTGDPLDLGLVGLAEFLPFVGLALVAGSVVDRYDRRRIIQICTTIFFACAVALFIMAQQPLNSVWPILAVLFVLGAARAFSMPAQQSLTPNLVPRAELGTAIAWGSSVFQVATIGGPALGGALFIFGAQAVYGGAAILLAIAAFLVAQIRTKTAERTQSPVTLETVFAGISFIRARPTILGAISLDLFAVLLGGVTALLPIFAADILKVGPTGLGLLRSAPAVGAALVAFYLVYRPIGTGAGRIMLISVAIFGVGTIGFGLSESSYLSLGLLTLIGAADMLSVFVRQTMIQAGTPDEMRGRVGSVNALFIGASNELGQFKSGLTADWFGVVPAVLIGGVGTLLITVIWAVRFPSLREVDLSPAGLDRLAAEGTAALATTPQDKAQNPNI